MVARLVARPEKPNESSTRAFAKTLLRKGFGEDDMQGIVIILEGGEFV